MIFYGKLALSNIMKNKKLYFSYLLTSVFTMVMYYIISSLSLNVGLEGHSTLGSFMNLGRYVIIVFALIILVTGILGQAFGKTVENIALIGIAIILVLLLIQSKRS